MTGLKHVPSHVVRFSFRVNLGVGQGFCRILPIRGLNHPQPDLSHLLRLPPQ